MEESNLKEAKAQNPFTDSSVIYTLTDGMTYKLKNFAVSRFIDITTGDVNTEVFLENKTRKSFQLDISPNDMIFLQFIVHIFKTDERLRNYLFHREQSYYDILLRNNEDITGGLLQSLENSLYVDKDEFETASLMLKSQYEYFEEHIQNNSLPFCLEHLSNVEDLAQFCKDGCEVSDNVSSMLYNDHYYVAPLLSCVKTRFKSRLFPHTSTINHESLVDMNFSRLEEISVYTPSLLFNCSITSTNSSFGNDTWYTSTPSSIRMQSLYRRVEFVTTKQHSLHEEESSHFEPRFEFALNDIGDGCVHYHMGDLDFHTNTYEIEWTETTYLSCLQNYSYKYNDEVVSIATLLENHGRERTARFMGCNEYIHHRITCMLYACIYNTAIGQKVYSSVFDDGMIVPNLCDPFLYNLYDFLCYHKRLPKGLLRTFRPIMELLASENEEYSEWYLQFMKMALKPIISVVVPLLARVELRGELRRHFFQSTDYYFIPSLGIHDAAFYKWWVPEEGAYDVCVGGVSEANMDIMCEKAALPREVERLYSFSLDESINTSFHAYVAYSMCSFSRRVDKKFKRILRIHNPIHLCYVGHNYRDGTRLCLPPPPYTNMKGHHYFSVDDDFMTGVSVIDYFVFFIYAAGLFLPSQNSNKGFRRNDPYTICGRSADRRVSHGVTGTEESPIASARFTAYAGSYRDILLNSGSKRKKKICQMANRDRNIFTNIISRPKNLRQRQRSLSGYMSNKDNCWSLVQMINFERRLRAIDLQMYSLDDYYDYDLVTLVYESLRYYRPFDDLSWCTREDLLLASDDFHHATMLYPTIQMLDHDSSFNIERLRYFTAPFYDDVDAIHIYPTTF